MTNPAKAVLIFIFSFLILLLLQLSTPALLGTDGYFYLKQSLLLPQNDFSNDLPWLPFTQLAQNNGGLHWGFTRLLYPFTVLFNPVLGAKIFIALIGALFFLLFFTVLGKLKIPGPII